jgi:hypothetical protein
VRHRRRLLRERHHELRRPQSSLLRLHLLHLEQLLLLRWFRHALLVRHLHHGHHRLHVHRLWRQGPALLLRHHIEQLLLLRGPVQGALRLLLGLQQHHRFLRLHLRSIDDDDTGV